MRLKNKKLKSSSTIYFNTKSLVLKCNYQFIKILTIDIVNEIVASDAFNILKLIDSVTDK